MFNKKKLLVATITGAAIGIACYLGGKYLFDLPFTAKNLGFIILNRAMIGFVIGISSLRLNWISHGAFLGTVVGSIFAYADFLFGFPLYVVYAILIANPFIGITIEFFSTIVFKSEA